MNLVTNISDVRVSPNLCHSAIWRKAEENKLYLEPSVIVVISVELVKTSHNSLSGIPHQDVSV